MKVGRRSLRFKAMAQVAAGAVPTAITLTSKQAFAQEESWQARAHNRKQESALRALKVRERDQDCCAECLALGELVQIL